MATKPQARQFVRTLAAAKSLSTFRWLERNWTADDAARAAIEAAYASALAAITNGAQEGDMTWDGSSGFAWTDADGKAFPMSAFDVMNLREALVRFTQRIATRAGEIIRQINAARSADDVDTSAWPRGAVQADDP